VTPATNALTEAVAPTTFDTPTRQPSVRDLGPPDAGLAPPRLSVAQLADIDAADPLAAPAQLFVWCLATGWTALRMCAQAFLRFLRAWDTGSAAVGRAAARAGRAAVAALSPLGDLMRRAFAPLGRVVLQFGQIASRALGPFAARLAARVAVAADWVGRHGAAALAHARPLLDRVAATSRRLTRVLAAAVRPITARAARAGAAIQRAAMQLRRVVRDKPRRPQLPPNVGRPE
jgi:hypothetical protein